MPEIARFYGIVIKMFFRPKEHNPPHIHVFYAEEYGSIDIRNLKMLEGDLSSETLRLVRKWARKHQAELLKMWDTQKIKKLPSTL